MSDESDEKVSGPPTAARNLELVQRLARAVRATAERPGEIAEVRNAVKEIAALAAKGAVRLSGAEGALLLDDAPLEAPDDDSRLLASRLQAYGVSELGITQRVAPADLADLVRLLAAAPTGDDPAAHFAARAAVIDSRTVPRKLKDRVRLTPAAELRVIPPPRRSVRATPTIASGPVPAAAAKEEESDLLREAMPVPATTDERLGRLFAAMSEARELAPLRAALDELANHADLAFRQGLDDALVESLTGFVAIEYAQLERDSSDERRQVFTSAVRRLARPVLLRHLAVLRHRRAAEPGVVAGLQAVLHRFGTDGVDALIDEYAAAPTLEARGAILESLRGLRRTFDALHALAREQSDPVVTQAASILGAIGGPRAQELLTEMLHHPSARARRSSVAALAQLGFPVAHDALRAALGDESTMVRARAVAAIAVAKEHAPQGVTLLAPLVEREEDREVLYSAIAALGALGGQEAVQLLVKVAEGAAGHARGRGPALRIQACTALVAIRTPAAMACVQGLTGDREREVRDAAVRLVAQAQRRTTQTIAIAT